MNTHDEIGYFELKPQKKNGRYKIIVLLHGWGANKERLRNLAEKLAGQGWYVVGIDLPGFGQTPSGQRALSVGDYAKFVHNFMEQKYGSKRKYVVFGHSFGGRVAARLAFASRNVVGIVLCATAGITRTNVVKRTVFAALAKVGKVLVVVPLLAGWFRKVLYKLAGERDYINANPVARQTFKQVIAEDIRPVLSRLSIPLLILWGDNDKMVPVAGAYIAKKLARRPLVKTFSGIGHTLPYVRPAAVAREITTWSKTFS